MNDFAAAFCKGWHLPYKWWVYIIDKQKFMNDLFYLKMEHLTKNIRWFPKSKTKTGYFI